MSIVDFLSTHTYRTVCVGSMMIGIVSGAIGCFAYLRKQSLVSDVVSHSALPGVFGAFLLCAAVLGIDGRSMPMLMAGAAITGTAAVLLLSAITRVSHIRADTAMAVTLTLFFGAGMLLMQVIADGPYPGKGGIQQYLFGNASVITVADLKEIGIIGFLALAVTVLAFKEFAVRTFDPEFAQAIGYPGKLLDTLMFAVIAVATVIGVKAVGLVLMVAFVVTPPAAARQWVRSLPAMVTVSAVIGAAGSAIGAYLSVALGKIPTGPITVLTLFAMFCISLLCAPNRSLWSRWRERSRARALLRAPIPGGES